MKEYTECQYCKEKIREGATVCPHCLRAQMSWYKIAMIGLFVVIGICIIVMAITFIGA